MDKSWKETQKNFECTYESLNPEVRRSSKAMLSIADLVPEH
jgi:hypothetical protein